MIALFKLLPFTWRVLAVLSVAATISATIYAVHRSIYKSGYQACETHITEKMRKQNDEARERIIALEDSYKKRLDDINKVGNNDLVGTGVSRAIDLMP